jgi:hypothetical protein
MEPQIKSRCKPNGGAYTGKGGRGIGAGQNIGVLVVTNAGY